MEARGPLKKKWKDSLLLFAIGKLFSLCTSEKCVTMLYAEILPGGWANLGYAKRREGGGGGGYSVRISKM